jgi:hypothetical protein
MQTETTLPVTSERSFFAALRALRHLYFKLEKDRFELHSNCELCDEIRNFLAVQNYCADDLESAFLTARHALIHLYNKLEADGMKLHLERCNACTEIREFIVNPEYRGNLDNPLEVDMHRPLNYAPLGWVSEELMESRRTS